MPSNTNPNDIIILYTSTLFDSELAAERPPFAQYAHGDAQLKQVMLDNAKSAAPYYDQYQILVQASFLDMRDESCCHFFLCEDTAPFVDNDRRIVSTTTEQELLCCVQQYIWQNHAAIRDINKVIMPVNFAGWKINNTWPFIVNRLFSYGYSVPAFYKTAPCRRFSSIDYLYDVSMLYTQGVSTAVRRLPALNDVLAYWNGGEALPGQHVIEEAICTDPVVAANLITSYLAHMEAAIRRYSCDVQVPVNVQKEN